jgi:lipid II:glycine glycyltransferase (peptidoglycan interpeptide bridge formation enzyme)
MIDIKPISIHDRTYIALASKLGSVFNQTAWLSIYDNKLTVLGIYNQNNELIGAFNIHTGQKFFLTYAMVPPFSPSNGLFLVNPALSQNGKITFEKSVHEAIQKYLKDSKFLLVLSSFPTSINDMQVYFWNQYKVIPNYTYQIDLNQSEQALFECLSSEKRKSIRKAIKDELVIEMCNNNQVVFDLISKTFKRKDKSVNDALIQKILFGFAQSHNSFAFVAFQNAKPIACTFVIYYGTTSYYLFGGYDDQLKHHGAGPVCMWQSMLHAKSLGIKTFDFEGSMLQEVERYFREFGGQLVSYFTIQKAWLPLEWLLKFKMRNRF